jgi:ammonium transporter, Amt family
MTRGLPSRAGFVALVVAILLGVLLNSLAFHSSSAQAPAAAPAAASTARADVAVPACNAKTLLNCSPNSGDTAWMPTSVALVLVMTTVTGVGLFYDWTIGLRVAKEIEVEGLDIRLQYRVVQ